MSPSPPLRLLRAGLLAGLALLLVAGIAAPAWAHPLGLPATARIVRTADDTVEVRWAAQPDDVAALAVAAGMDGVGELTPETSLSSAQDRELAGSDALRAEVLDELAVTVDGAPCEPAYGPQPTVATHGVQVAFTCPAPAEQVEVTIGLLHELDARYRTLAAATTPDGETQTMFTGEAPTHTFRLVEVGTAAGGAGAASDDDTAGTTAGDGAAAEAEQVTSGLSGFGTGWLDDRFLAAIDRPAGLAASVVGLLLALGVGAVHALAPGHGKAIAAAYLVGDHGRRRDALVLGSTVALMHTGSVLLLGFALFSTTAAPDAARLGASIEVVAGATFVGLGGWLLWRRWRDRDTGHDHDDTDAPHDHTGDADVTRDHDGDHTHDHGEAHAHHPVPEVDEDASHLQRIVALGAAGGLLPSPSALLVLLTALAIDRLGYGLALVGAFSIGLAATLTAVGLMVLSGRDLAERRLPARFHRWLHAAPLLGAAAVVVIGGAVLTRAMLRLV